MKKEFAIPEINISEFSAENIVTVSSALMNDAAASVTTGGGLTIDGQSNISPDKLFTINF